MDQPNDRRRKAGEDYPKAAEIAAAAGIALIRHTEAHYEMKTPGWMLEIYPGNRRIFSLSKSRPFLELPEDWGLIDVAEAAAEHFPARPTLGDCIEVAAPWVVMWKSKNGNNMNYFHCERCGAVLYVELPVDLDVFRTTAERFLDVHCHCKGASNGNDQD